jgi:radial spoke head protein 9
MGEPSKKWFYATTRNLVLQQLPDLTEAFAKTAATISGRFLGNPAKLLGPDADAAEEEDAVDEAGNPKPKTVRFSEAHRLAFVVGRIDSDTGLVPRGAYAVSPTHHVVENTLFAGLSATEATSLAAYQHFRRATHPSRAHALHKSGVVPVTDFLDPASEDAPEGTCWTVRLDGGKGLVEVRSLKWPGYFFMHSVGTPKYGGVYVGDGQQNTDLQFML